MLVSLTVGKVDAGVAVLLTEDKRLVLLLDSGRNLSNHPTDRVPFHLTPTLNHFRLYCRHYSVPEL